MNKLKYYGSICIILIVLSCSKDKDKSSVLDYRSAGVNIDAGNSLVSNIAEITKVHCLAA